MNFVQGMAGAGVPPKTRTQSTVKALVSFQEYYGFDVIGNSRNQVGRRNPNCKHGQSVTITTHNTHEHEGCSNSGEHNDPLTDIRDGLGRRRIDRGTTYSRQ